MTGQPILVTGTHRSGTTWVAKTLARSPGAAYVTEPFNPRSSNGVCRAEFRYWFTYVDRHNSDAYEESFRRMLAFQYNWPGAAEPPYSIRSIGRTAMEASRFTWYRAFHSRPVLKDSIAVFSVPWLVASFDVRPVIMIRHPAAFVSSILRLGWEHPFDHFLSQEDLMRRYLEPYRDAVEWAAESRRPLLDQAILLWNLINSVVAQYSEMELGALVLRHEDVASNPTFWFAHMCRELGLRQTPRLTERIVRQSSPRNPTEAPHNVAHHLARNSAAIVKAWTTTLNASDVRKIRSATEDLSSRWYSDDDWSA